MNKNDKETVVAVAPENEMNKDYEIRIEEIIDEQILAKEKNAKMEKELDEKLVCCECGSDNVEFCTLGWFDAKTHGLNQIADLGCDYTRELYCRGCQDRVGDYIHKYEFDPLEVDADVNKNCAVDKNYHIQYYILRAHKKEDIQHNENGEMVCCYCNSSNNLEYSVYAWFDLNTEKFVEYAEDPQALSYTSVWCNDCEALYPQIVSEEEYNNRLVEILKKQTKTDIVETELFKNIDGNVI